MKNLTVPLALIISASTLPAQQARPSLNCDKEGGNRNRAHFCEMREQPGSASGMISVDASTNGGISIQGWDRSDILVRAQVRADAPTEDQARDLVRQVNVQATGPQVRAYGPKNENDRNWSVNYEVFVPKRYSATLETVNGGVSIADVNGNLEFKTVNGGLSLRNVGGYVHGKTTNGGVSVALAGDHWDGQGLDVTTTNGGVSMKMPQNYSAQLEAQTNNGGIQAADFVSQPLEVHSGQQNRVSAPIGRGGAILKVSTVNGGLSLKKI